MKVIERKPVPIYEVVCYECKSKIHYKACEVAWFCITCPVCGVSISAEITNPVCYEDFIEQDSSV